MCTAQANQHIVQTCTFLNYCKKRPQKCILLKMFYIYNLIEYANIYVNIV